MFAATTLQPLSVYMAASMSFTALLKDQLFQLKQVRSRTYPLLDCLRGITVINMALWHFVFNFSLFGYMQPYYYTQPEMVWWRATIIYPFCFLFGLSIAIAHQRGVFWQGFQSRMIKLGFAAGLVSLATFIAFGASWVYFGILHFFAFASVVAIIFLGRHLLALITAIVLAYLYYVENWSIPWFEPTRPSYEYIPLCPNLIYVLLGMAALPLGMQTWCKNWKFPKPLIYAGQHSIFIYLAHLPALYALFMLASWLGFGGNYAGF